MITKMTVLFAISPAAAAPFLCAMTMLVAQVDRFDFFSNDRLVSFCLIGSGIGAILSVALWMPPDDALPKAFVRRILMKFGTSMLSGAVASPFMLERYGEQVGLNPGEVPTPAVCLAVSAFVAVVAVAAVHLAAPIVERRLKKILLKISGETETPGDKK